MDAKEIIELQRTHLDKLQAATPRPILIKAFEGATPQGADARLYDWNYYMDVFSSIEQPIYTRRILDNEILLDPDVKNWNVLKTECDKLIRYLELKKIPYRVAYSGGNGCHISIIFSSIGIDNDLFSELKKYDIDVYKITRQTLTAIIFNESGADREALNIDNKKINFGMGRLGSMVRTYGTPRPNGNYKTFIDSIPENKPEVGSLPLRFPENITQWDISEYQAIITEKLKYSIENAKNAPEYREVKLSGCALTGFPCIAKLINEGRTAGRYYGAGAIALVAKRTGMTWEGVEPIIRKYLEKSALFDNTLSESDIQLRIDNTKPLFESKDYNFSCRYIKEEFTDKNYCDFGNCIICKKINDIEKEPGNVINELSTEEIKELGIKERSRKINLNLPEGHFINHYVKWLSSISDGYKEYMIVCGFWILSALTKGKFILRLKQEKVKPNLWINNIGKSTTSRKSTIVNATRHIIECATDILLPNQDFSLEGYLETLSKNSKADHVRDEAAGLLSKFHQKYNDGIFDFECQLYDCQNSSKTLASKGNKEPRTFEVINPYITKLYATTAENLSRCLTIDDFMSGYGYRWIFTYPNYPHDRKPLEMEGEEDTQAWAHVLQKIKVLYNAFNKITGTVDFKVAPGVMEYYDKICQELEEKAEESNNDILNSIVGRSEIHILKIAMLLELGKQELSTTINEDSIEQSAKMVTDFFIPSIMDLISRLQEDVKNNKIERIRAILRRLGGTATHTKLLRDSHIVAREFMECIDTMIESKTIRIVCNKENKNKIYILQDHNEDLKISNVRKVRNVSIYTNGIDTIANNANSISIDTHQGDNNLNVYANVANPANPANIKKDKSVTELNNQCGICGKDLDLGEHEFIGKGLGNVHTKCKYESRRIRAKLNTQYVAMNTHTPSQMTAGQEYDIPAIQALDFIRSGLAEEVVA